MKRFIATMLAVMMLITMIPTSVFAENTIEPMATPVVTVEPTAEPAVEPTEEPVVEPTEESTEEPAVEPTEEPAVEPTEEPIVEPTEEPVVEPTEEPIVEPTEEPVVEPTEEPIVEPMEEPVVEPTEEPIVEPTEEPIVESTEEPMQEMITGDSEQSINSAPVNKFNGYKTLEDFGISSAQIYSLRRSSSSVYLNPQTIRPSSSYYGYEWIWNRSGYKYPFTASFTLDGDYMPQNSVYIAIANYDCDEDPGRYVNCEYDQVYINGHLVGVLTGNNDTSNTTLLKVDRSILKAGTNSISIRITNKYVEDYYGYPAGSFYEDDTWKLRVDDIQVLCDGGSVEGRPDVFRVNLTNAKLSGNKVYCYVTTQVEDSQNRTFSLEYALYDWSSEESATYGQIIDDDFATIYDGNYDHEGSLTMPVNSLSGTYTAVVYLKVKENGMETILAYDEESFEYETGIAPAFDVQNFTATPATLEWTSEPVAINLSADIDVNAGLTNLYFYISDAIQTPASVDANGHVTGTLVLPANGFYTVELHYTKDGTNYKKATTVEINNILTPLEAPVLNVSGDFNIAEGETVSIDWNQVVNATAYSIIVWDFTGLPLDATSAPEVDRVNDQEALTYSYTFNKAGAYIIGVYSRCPGSTEYCQSRTAGAVNVYVTASAPACLHTNVTAYYDNGAQPPLFSNITETHHDVQNGYMMYCEDCKQYTGETGYFDAVPEQHIFTNGDVCVCGYDRKNCAHTYTEFDYVYGTGNWVDCGDGTHKRVSVVINYTCVKCGASIEERIEEDSQPAVHTTKSSEKKVGYVQVFAPDPASGKMHRVKYQITTSCTANGCEYTSSTTEYRWEVHDLAKKCVCGYTMTDEELYENILSSLPNGANPMDNPVIVEIIEDQLTAEGLTQTQVADIIDTVENAPEMYRNIYVYSFFEYNIDSVTANGSFFSPSTNGLNIGANTSPANFLNTWFHETGHAVDWNAGIGNLLTLDSNFGLYSALESDLAVRINATIDDEVAGLLRNKLNPGSVVLTEQEERTIRNNILGAQNAPYAGLFGTTDPTPDNVSGDVKTIYNRTRDAIQDDLAQIPYSNARMGSDVNGGLSNNTVRGSFGHNYPFGSGTTYWFNGNSETGNQCAEAWAEYYSAYMLNDTAAIAENRRYFPSACVILDDIAEQMCDYYMGQY